MTIKTSFKKTTLPRIQFEVRDTNGIQSDVLVSLEWDPYYLCPCSATEGARLVGNRIEWPGQSISEDGKLFSVSFACERPGTANTRCRAVGTDSDSKAARVTCPSRLDEPSVYECGGVPNGDIPLPTDCQPNP